MILEIFKKRLLEVIARICFYRFTIKISGMARTITNQNYRKCLNITHRIYHVCRNIWKIVKQFVSGTAMRRIPDVDFYQICQLLLKYQVEVHVVKLSEHVVREDCIVSYANWGEVAAEEFAGFLSYEKILTEDEFRMYAQNWTDLVSENAPLRAVISGQLISVPEDFYDFLIWKHLSDKPRKEARVIGDILGTSMLGVGDWWYAKRIEYYIDRGDILIVEDSANTYARVIKAVQVNGWRDLNENGMVIIYDYEKIDIENWAA